jgi:hypothetical protein
MITGKLQLPHVYIDLSCERTWLGIEKNDNGIWIGLDDKLEIGYDNWLTADESRKVDYNYAFIGSGTEKLN